MKINWKPLLMALAFALILSWIVEILWETHGQPSYLIPPIFAVSWIFLYYLFKKKKEAMPI